MAAVNDGAKDSPVRGASVWRGADLERDRSWEFVLNEAGRNELRAATATARKSRAGFADIDAAAFPLPRLAPVAARIGRELRDGRGFALLRGFPVEGHGLDEIETMYWGFCAHLGTAVSQNGDGGLIHYVTEGPLRPNQGTRAVGFPREAPLHVDLADAVSLLCVRQAPDNPPSRVASSMTVHNALLAERPEWMAAARRGFAWDRMEEHGAHETPSSDYRVPLFSRAGDTVSARYNRHWIESAAQRAGRRLAADEEALFDFVDGIARETCFEFAFGAGDAQFCNNYTVMHGRAAHEPEADADRRRLLMRIWFDVSAFRAFSDEAVVRYGVGRHGRLGWTADELRRGADRRPRPRRADGAVDPGAIAGAS